MLLDWLMLKSHVGLVGLCGGIIETKVGFPVDSWGGSNQHPPGAAHLKVSKQQTMATPV